MMTLSDFTLPRLDGSPQPLADYAGQLVLVVNTASRCGLTPQLEGLEWLFRNYGDEGFVVLGFPSNQFAGQEPGSAAEIAEFCSLTYDVSFPLFGKLEVNGPGTHPLYAWLKASHKGDIEWNFAKFLIGRDGLVAARYAPETLPAALVPDIERLL